MQDETASSNNDIPVALVSPVNPIAPVKLAVCKMLSAVLWWQQCYILMQICQCEPAADAENWQMQEAACRMARHTCRACVPVKPVAPVDPVNLQVRETVSCIVKATMQYIMQCEPLANREDWQVQVEAACQMARHTCRAGGSSAS